MLSFSSVDKNLKYFLSSSENAKNFDIPFNSLSKDVFSISIEGLKSESSSELYSSNSSSQTKLNFLDLPSLRVVSL